MKYGVVAAAAATLLMRLAHLRSLPIFNDEAIYLRWAQQIAEMPSLWLRLPLTDPKPPLHPLLLAIATHFASDPLVPARVVSALAGALTVAAVATFAAKYKAAAAAALLVALCPFAAFYQRLATPDALFVLLSIVSISVGLRLADEPTPRNAIALGLALAAAMLTRQVFSYVLLFIPLVAIRTRRALGWYGVAAAIALICWSPFLLADRDRYRDDPVEELRRRAFYQKQFSAETERVPLIAANTKKVAQWYWLYLTPPVVIAACLSMIWLAVRRIRLFILLAVWTAALLAPLIFFATVTYSRYALPAAIPLLIGLAVACTDLFRRPAVLAIALTALCAWPVHDLYLQVTRWDRQPFTAHDRWQYVTGWPAGHAAEQGLDWLRQRAAQQSIVIVTDGGIGNPSDTIRVYSQGARNITLRNAGSPNALETMTYPPERPVYYVTRDPVAELQPAAEFRNLNLASSGGVHVYRIR